MSQTYAKIAEYRDIEGEPRSKTTRHDSRVKEGREYFLTSATAGYECAGAMARWTDGYWSVTFYLDGATHGRRFKTEEEARRLFDLWTKAEEN